MSKVKTERGSGTTFLREKGPTMVKAKTPPAPHTEDNSPWKTVSPTREERTLCGKRLVVRVVGGKTWSALVDGKVVAAGLDDKMTAQWRAETVAESDSLPPELKPVVTAAPEATTEPPADRTRLAWANGAFAIVTIFKGGKPQDYLAEILSPNVHRLTKLEAGRSTTYLVKIGKEKACGCDGHRHGHDCKHILALLALKTAKEEGRI